MYVVMIMKVKEIILRALKVLVAMVVLFFPQYFVMNSDWQTKAIYFGISIVIVGIILEWDIQEVFLSKGGIALKIKQLDEDTAAVRQLGLGLMKSTLVMIANDDRNFQTLKPVQKVDLYYTLLDTKKQLNLTGEELDRAFHEVEESIDRGFLNYFESLHMDKEKMVGYDQGRINFQFENIREVINGLPSEEAREEFGKALDACKKFSKRNKV